MILIAKVKILFFHTKGYEITVIKGNLSEKASVVLIDLILINYFYENEKPSEIEIESRVEKAIKNCNQSD